MSDPDEVGSRESTNRRLWERHAAWWQREFTEGADPEYEEQILPLVANRLSDLSSTGVAVLDVGCGEGQVARRLAAQSGRGGVVVGVDPVANQVDVAYERGGGPLYSRAAAGALPFPDAGFDAVVACLVFEHIDPLEPAIAEVARVLRPGGVFLFLLNHPLLQSPDAGWVVDHTVEPPEQYWRIGAYLDETHLVEEVEKDVFIPFVHRPLGRYLNTLRRSGLVLDEMLEPPPPEGFLERAPGYGAASAVPRLLVLVCRRL